MSSKSIYIYDEFQELQAAAGLKEKLLKYDFTYSNKYTSVDFLNVIFMRIGYVNDIEVFVQYNVVTKQFRTILIYDKYDKYGNMHTYDDIKETAKFLQRELGKTCFDSKKCNDNTIPSYCYHLKAIYDYQEKTDANDYVFLQDLKNETGIEYSFTNGREIRKLIDKRNIYLYKLEDVNKKLSDFGLNVDYLVRGDIQDHYKRYDPYGVDASKLHESQKYTYKTDMGGNIGEVYENILNCLSSTDLVRMNAMGLFEIKNK